MRIGSGSELVTLLWAKEPVHGHPRCKKTLNPETVKVLPKQMRTEESP